MNLLIDRDVKVLYTVGEKTAQRLYTEGIHTVRDVQENRERVIRLLGKQGERITQIARGIDDRKVTPYRPEDAKSISRELTFQEDVENFDFLKDVLFLLSLMVENRAHRKGLHGNGISLKLTYADMKGITRSRAVPPVDTAIVIYKEASQMLDQVQKRPVRLIGVGIYNLAGEEGRQLSFDEVFEELGKARETERTQRFDGLREKYHLDFAGHLDQLYQMDTLYRTVEYMRKHISV